MIKLNLIVFVVMAIPLFLFGFVKKADATVMVGGVESYGKTYLNYFMNHDYIERDKPYLYGYSAKALERVRQQLVRERKIEDIWVVFEIPSTVFELESKTSSIGKKSKCQIDYGETGQKPAELNNCYHVYFVGESNYSNLLSLLLALQQIKEEGKPIVVEDPDNYAQSNAFQVTNYLGGVYYTRPVWSPNSKFVAFGVWKDDQIHYEVYDIDQNQYLTANPLNQMFVTEPIWSSDSRYLFFASLSEIKMFDTKTVLTTTIDIGKLSEGKNFETLLSFDNLEGKLVYAFDTNLLSNYDIYEYNLQSNQSNLRVRNVSYISWRNQADNNFKQVTSPDGRWEAKVEDKVTGDARDVKKLSTQGDPGSGGIKQTEIAPLNGNGQASGLKWIILAIFGGTVLLSGGFLLGNSFAVKKHLKNQGVNNPTVLQ